MRLTLTTTLLALLRAPCGSGKRSLILRGTVQNESNLSFHPENPVDNKSLSLDSDIIKADQVHVSTLKDNRGLQGCPPNGYWDEADNKCSCHWWDVWTGDACCPPHGYYDWGAGKCSCHSWDVWTGDACCPPNASYDWSASQCFCNTDYEWDGSLCVASSSGCPPNGYWDAANNKCSCHSWDVWTGDACCPANAYYDWSASQCTCNSGFQWDGSVCSASAFTHNCPPNGYWDVRNNKCSCASSDVWTGDACCPANAYYDWDQAKCTCHSGYVWNGSACTSSSSSSPGCPPNGYWDVANDKCSCRDSDQWTGDACCPHNARYDWDQGACVCISPTFWTGTECQWACNHPSCSNPDRTANIGCGDGVCNGVGAPEDCALCPQDCGTCPKGQTTQSKCTKRSIGKDIFGGRPCPPGYVDLGLWCTQRCDTVHFRDVAFIDCGWRSAAECAVDHDLCQQTPVEIYSPWLSSTGKDLADAVAIIGNLINNIISFVEIGNNLCPWDGIGE